MDPRLYKAAVDSQSSCENLTDLDSNALQLTCGQRNTILHVAAKSGNKHTAAHILESHPSLAYKTNKKGDTPLHIAARFGHYDVAALLIRCTIRPEVGARVPIRMVNLEKNTALHEAVRNGYSGIVKLLIKEDPGLTLLTNKDGESPMFIAVERGCYETAICILETFPSCSIWGRNGMTVMHAAAASTFCCGQQDLICEMLRRFGSVILEVIDDFGWMPLHYAVQLGHVDVVQLFLKANDSLAYITDDSGPSALHIAARNGHDGVVRKLIEIRPDVCELLDNKGQTALHVAVENGKIDVVRMLLDMTEFDDLINEKDKQGNTCFHLAAIHGNVEILKILAKNRIVDGRLINERWMTAFDIIRSSTELTNAEKIMIISSVDILETPTSETKNHEISAEETDQRVEGESAQGAKGNVYEEHIVVSNRNDEMSIILPNFHKDEGFTPEDVKNMANINLVIATIIASITFAAAVQVPGGFNADGIANLRRKASFRMFLIYDSLAFGWSVASMLLHFGVALYSSFLGRRRQPFTMPVYFVMLSSGLSISLLIVAFMWATNAVLYDDIEALDVRCVYKFMTFRLGLPANIAFFSFVITAVYMMKHVISPVMIFGYFRRMVESFRGFLLNRP